jgi:glycosyltransferase involved in cell wall biosynthesis
VVGGLAARAAGVARVSTCHGFIDSDWRGRFYQWIQRKVLRGFDAVVAVSGVIAERLRESGVPAGRIVVLPNAFAGASGGLDRTAARAALGLSDAPAIGWIGRLSAEKGPDLALEALARVPRPARLVVIGGGRDEVALRARAAALGIDDRITWAGVLPDAARFLPAFDAFLLSSRTEGTPIALLEAIAAGVPVVATKVGGVPDVVDERSARLTAAGDVDAMGAAIADVLEDPTRARSRADQASSRLADQFAIEPWLARYAEVYREAARSRGVAARRG